MKKIRPQKLGFVIYPCEIMSVWSFTGSWWAPSKCPEWGKLCWYSVGKVTCLQTMLHVASIDPQSLPPSPFHPCPHNHPHSVGSPHHCPWFGHIHSCFITEGYIKRFSIISCSHRKSELWRDFKPPKRKLKILFVLLGVITHVNQQIKKEKQNLSCILQSGYKFWCG